MYLKTFLPVSAQKSTDFSIGMTRYDVLDNFTFDLKSLTKNERVIAVFRKITFMTSRDFRSWSE